MALAQFISERLCLPAAIAGVTVLSFAGGAPDLFTQLAAVTAGGGHEDLGLAVSSTLGSGLFITCLMTAAVACMLGDAEVPHPPRAPLLARKRPAHVCTHCAVSRGVQSP